MEANSNSRRLRFLLRALFVGTTVLAIGCWLVVAFPVFGPFGACFFTAFCLGVLGARSRSGTAIKLSVLLFLVGGLLSLPVMLMDGHPVSMRKLSQVRPGVTSAKVTRLLGEPTTVNVTTDGEDWIYSAPTWCVVTVRFSNEKVVEVEHDH